MAFPKLGDRCREYLDKYIPGFYSWYQSAIWYWEKHESWLGEEPPIGEVSFPIGTIILTNTNDNPSSSLGGTWEAY